MPKDSSFGSIDLLTFLMTFSVISFKGFFFTEYNVINVYKDLLYNITYYKTVALSGFSFRATPRSSHTVSVKEQTTWQNATLRVATCVFYLQSMVTE